MGGLKTLIDGMDDATSAAYDSFPDRLFMVGKDGKIAYAGGRGPRGFEPNESEDSIRVALELSPVERSDVPKRKRGQRGQRDEN